MPTYLQPKPFELLKSTVRGYRKPYKMYDNSKRNEYDKIHRAASELRQHTKSLKINTAIAFDIRVKNLIHVIESVLNFSAWFKIDQLEYSNKILKQFDDAMKILLNAETINAQEISFMKEAHADYIVWLDTHKELISFTYVYHNNILKYMKCEETLQSEEGLDSILDIIIKESAKVIDAVDGIRLINKKQGLEEQDREAKLIALQSKINLNSEWQ